MPRGRKRKNPVFVPQPWLHNSSSEGEQQEEPNLDAPDGVVVGDVHPDGVVVGDVDPDGVVVEDVHPDGVVVGDDTPDGVVGGAVGPNGVVVGDDTPDEDDDIRELMEQSRYDQLTGNIINCFVRKF